MTGVKLGDQVMQFGCADGGPLAAVAAKVGLSGRAVAAVADDAAAARTQKAAAKAGVLSKWNGCATIDFRSTTVCSTSQSWTTPTEHVAALRPKNGSPSSASCPELCGPAAGP